MKNMPCDYHKVRGIAAIEMTFVLPILIILAFGVVEIVHAIQAKNVSISLAREGANLASRSTADSEQDIMDALALSAQPLDFSKNGVIYISVVVGDSELMPYISEQHRWKKHGYTSSSTTWSRCSNWTRDGSCRLPSNRPRLENFPMILAEGETVHIVEVVYEYAWFTDIIFDQNIVIHSDALM